MSVQQRHWQGAWPVAYPPILERWAGHPAPALGHGHWRLSRPWCWQCIQIPSQLTGFGTQPSPHPPACGHQDEMPLATAPHAKATATPGQRSAPPEGPGPGPTHQCTGVTPGPLWPQQPEAQPPRAASLLQPSGPASPSSRQMPALGTHSSTDLPAG